MERSAFAFIAIALLVAASLAVVAFTVQGKPPGNESTASISTPSTTSSVAPTLLAPGPVVPFGNYTFGQGGFRYLSTGCSDPSLCFGNRSMAIVFDCAQTAASPQGCTKTFATTPVYAGGTVYVYSIRVWYSYRNYTAEVSWINCAFEIVRPLSGPWGGYCMPINSSSFLVSEPIIPVAPP